MSVCNVLVTVAAVVLGTNGAPTNTGYFLANDLSTISNEVGLTASTTTNGISFAIGETASSKQFAVAVDESRFVIGLYVPEQRYNSHLAVTVTNPKTGVSIETKVMLRVDSDGLGHVTLASTGKYLGGFENYFIQIVVTSDGYMGLGPVVDSTRTIRFAAYNYMLYYDATHKFFMLTLSAQSLPAYSKISFNTDVLFLTRKPSSTGSSDESPDPGSPKRGDQLSDTDTTSAASKTANASFWKSKWWIIVVCVIVVILLLAAAGVGGVLACKKIKSRMTEKSKSKGQLGRTEDSGALSNVPSTTIQSVKPSGKENTDDTIFGNESTNEQNTTKKSIMTETTEQRDTTVEPDTTQTQKSVAKKTVVEAKANYAPAAKQDPNYQTLAALSKAKKAPVLTTAKAAPKQKDPNYQRPDGISNDSIMTSTKGDKTPAAKTEKAPPKKPEANHQTVASSKDPKMSGDSTEDKTSAKKTDKTASKKPKRYFLKRTTGTDDYPEFTVTDTKRINAIPKVSSSKDPRSAADNDKVSSKKADKTAPKKPKLYFMNRTTVTDDFPSAIVADKAPTTKTDK